MLQQLACRDYTDLKILQQSLSASQHYLLPELEPVQEILFRRISEKSEL